MNDTSLNDATRAQIEAARPDASTWLGANAGSGKTRVLTDRVARLLLDGVDPQKILCLTYTKAAASEMQNRLFKRLGAWAMLGDAELRKALEELGTAGEIGTAQLRDARTLFARAIETPGGLKIQTIHSFCASLLRRFPLESRVSPQFIEMEERAADLLRADIVENMAGDPEGDLMEAVAQHCGAEDLSSLTQAIVSKREAFEAPLDEADCLTLFGLDPDTTEASICAEVLLGGEADLLASLLPFLKEGSPTDQKAADALASVRQLDHDALQVLESVMLTGASAADPFGAKIDKFPTKATQKKSGHLQDDLNALMKRVESARARRIALAAARRTFVLHRFASAFLHRYAEAKEARGWLDFDDLILKARSLLTDSEAAAWVLYRIDGGIDHILVDEAQDTSPRQWDVIERLTDEFFSGAAAREGNARTIFVVGDKKQSIYSFQGADPLEFDRRRAHFETASREARKTFQSRSLDYSFRSSSAILRLVDTMFDPRQRGTFDKDTQHIAFKDTLPGRVDLWPVVPPAESADDRVWTDPLDRKGERHHDVLLAEQIAAQIKTLVEEEHYIPDDDAENGVFRRRIRPGDFLILVQRRSAVFSEIIRACKAAGLPIAGADRLKVGAELAVRDIGALLSFLATADDSLSLATALRSPLFGWSEDELFELAHPRPEKHLWQALRNEGERWPQTVSMLRDLRDQIDFLRPYDLIERILTRHDGRRKLLARLGPEAEDGINAMLSQALAYERNAVPSLTGFLQWMETDDLEIKRQIDSATDQIRVMTVHGAKGLEAPIVILPDTAPRRVDIRDQIVELPEGPVWKPLAAQMTPEIQARTEEMKAAIREERLRLLYVAATRAEKWLIVAMAGKPGKDGSGWYDIVEDAIGTLRSPGTGDGTLRFEEGDWNALPIRDIRPQAQRPAPLDPAFTQAPPALLPPPEVLSPSDLGGPKALPGDEGWDHDAATDYGTLVHFLLDRLPGLNTEAAGDVVRTLVPTVEETLLAQAEAEARAVIDAPSFAHFFGGETFSEVAVTGLYGARRLHGSIDRLTIGPDRIVALDFKTNRVVPADVSHCPEGILRQMGAYLHLLRQIYPEREIEVGLLWTNGPAYMPLPERLVLDALARAPDLDGDRPAT